MKLRIQAATRSSPLNRPAFDRKFGFTWAMLATIALVDVVWLACGKWHVQWHSLLNRTMLIAALYLPLVLARCRRSERVRSLCDAYAVVAAFSTGATILMYLVVSTAHPLTDPYFAAADRRLGFDWGSYYQWLTGHPGYARAVRIPYDWIVPELWVVMAFLALNGRRERLVELVELLASMLVMTIVISYFFPAAGAAKYFWPQYHADISHWTQFESLRSGALRTIDVSLMQGLVSMPSYHTVIGLLLCWSVRGTRASATLIILNSMMLLAAPVYGGHYAVDLAAAALMTAAAIALRHRVTMLDASPSTVRPRVAVDG